jgi:hypothetical protein
MAKKSQNKLIFLTAAVPDEAFSLSRSFQHSSI